MALDAPLCKDGMTAAAFLFFGVRSKTWKT
jgi:hypothetical protein